MWVSQGPMETKGNGNLRCAIKLNQRAGVESARRVSDEIRKLVFQRVSNMS